MSDMMNKPKIEKRTSSNAALNQRQKRLIRMCEYITTEAKRLGITEKSTITARYDFKDHIIETFRFTEGALTRQLAEDLYNNARYNIGFGENVTEENKGQ